MNLPTVCKGGGSSDLFEIAAHLCFNITMKGQTTVPDWYSRNLQYTRKYVKTMFSNENWINSDSILSSYGL